MTEADIFRVLRERFPHYCLTIRRAVAAIPYPYTVILQIGQSWVTSHGGTSFAALATAAELACRLHAPVIGLPPGECPSWVWDYLENAALERRGESGSDPG